MTRLGVRLALGLLAVGLDAQRIPGVGRFVVPSVVSFTCTSTLTTASNLPAAVSGAANGSTLCLEAGSYGTEDLFDIARTGFVTIRPVAGATVTINPRVGNTD